MAYTDFAASGPAGHAIFLLHGKNFDSSYWSGPINWLRDAGSRAIGPDQLGFNKSAKPDIDYSFTEEDHTTTKCAGRAQTSPLQSAR
ncbi:MAG TPA: hypothetical protein VL356_05900 [Acidocella sp.]|nr:hypothetical protein [Acidocella sp.]